jgi:hypothetical protein
MCREAETGMACLGGAVNDPTRNFALNIRKIPASATSSLWVNLLLSNVEFENLISVMVECLRRTPTQMPVEAIRPTFRIGGTAEE